MSVSGDETLTQRAKFHITLKAFLFLDASVSVINSHDSIMSHTSKWAIKYLAFMINQNEFIA